MKLGDTVQAVFEENGREYIGEAVVVYISPITNGFHQVEWFDGSFGWVKSEDIF